MRAGIRSKCRGKRDIPNLDMDVWVRGVGVELEGVSDCRCGKDGRSRPASQSPAATRSQTHFHFSLRLVSSLQPPPLLSTVFAIISSHSSFRPPQTSSATAGVSGAQLNLDRSRPSVVPVVVGGSDLVAKSTCCTPAVAPINRRAATTPELSED